jgi:hypothetical protein
MIEVFLLIGWIDGHKAGRTVSHEFYSLATCEAAKAKYVQMHEIKPEDRNYYGSSWVECVKK